MFAVLTAATILKPPLGRRISQRLQRKNWIEVFQDRTLGICVLRADLTFFCGMSEKQRIRRVEAAARLIAQAGICGVVPPAGFRYGAVLERWGLTCAVPEPLYRKMAGEMAAYFLSVRGIAPGQTTAAVFADRITRDVSGAIDRLCRITRHIAVYCPVDTGAFCDGLRAKYGISILENPPYSEIGQARLFLLFGYPPDFSACRIGRDAGLFLFGPPAMEIPVLNTTVISGARLIVPEKLRGRLPPGCHTDALLTALTAAGAVEVNQIGIRGLTYDGQMIL